MAESSKIIELKHFTEIDLNDSFFDSLKQDYVGFDEWFLRKCRGREDAYVHYSNDGVVDGFLYFKHEGSLVSDVLPKIMGRSILKIGTFKINPHGSRLGERFLKKALDYAISIDADTIYVTLFPKQNALIDLFLKYGFRKHGYKKTLSGEELVLVKKMELKGDVFSDYPLININGGRKYIISIYPQYHSIMFPDSILKTERVDILEDVTITNSIHKNYVTRMLDIPKLRKGDILLIYRTSEKDKSAEYSSVVTSVCVVNDVKAQEAFDGFEEFYKYASTYSIFDREDLKHWYNRKGCFVVNMTYNAALSKRIIRHDIIEKAGVSRNSYWGLLEINDEQFQKIVAMGDVPENVFR